MQPLDYLLSAAAVWYVAYAVTSSGGPFDVFKTARKALPHGGLLDCPVCLSLWVAAFVVWTQGGAVLDVFAVAGIAMLAHGFSGWRYN